MDGKNRGFVYLLGDWEKENTYKIGVTRGTIDNRIKKLQTGNAGDIYLVNYFHSEHPFFVEKWLHTKFCKNNVKNEWFNLSIDDLNKFIEYCEQFEKLYEYTKCGKS